MGAALSLQGATSIAQQVNAYIQQQGISKAALALEVGYSRPTLSMFLGGKYASDSTEIEERLASYLREKTGEGILAATPLATFSPDFFDSRDAKVIIGLCQSCQEYIGLGIVVGRSGFGKTHALKHYAKLPKVAYIECDDTMACRDLVESIESALGLPRGYGTIWRRVNCIKDFFTANKGYLLVIDEADKLISKYTQKKMEILRAIFDQADVGLVFAGEPKLEVQIKSYLPRMANRVDFYSMLHGLSTKEVESYLSGYPIEGEALAELNLRASNMQTGCFRLLNRTLKNAMRILQEEQLEYINMTVIKQASSMMML